MDNPYFTVNIHHRHIYINIGTWSIIKSWKTGVLKCPQILNKVSKIVVLFNWVLNIVEVWRTGNQISPRLVLSIRYEERYAVLISKTEEYLCHETVCYQIVSQWKIVKNGETNNVVYYDNSVVVSNWIFRKFWYIVMYISGGKIGDNRNK